MIDITVSLEDLSNVMLVFDSVQIRKYVGTVLPPPDIVEEVYYTTISGIDVMSNRSGVSDVILLDQYIDYYYTDPDGLGTDWYTSRYFNSTTSGTSGWTPPILGETNNIFCNPMYPPETMIGSTDKMIIDRIRLYIGDPVELNLDQGEWFESNFSDHNNVYILEEKGWPASINLYGVQYTDSKNPCVNGNKFLKFQDGLAFVPTTISGNQDISIWYYTFRKSDREILSAYDTTWPPYPLTADSCTQEVFMLQAAYDLLVGETWEAISEDGASITDHNDSYNPCCGLSARKDMLDALRKKLDGIIPQLSLYRGGHRIE